MTIWARSGGVKGSGKSKGKECAPQRSWKEDQSPEKEEKKKAAPENGPDVCFSE